MRIGRVVGLAPRRPDSPSPCIHLRAPSDPPPKEPPAQIDERLDRILIVNVPVLRRDLRRIKDGSKTRQKESKYTSKPGKCWFPSSSRARSKRVMNQTM
eukprot:512884-Pelagomonas_calceolata.AAC.1